MTHELVKRADEVDRLVRRVVGTANPVSITECWEHRRDGETTYLKYAIGQRKTTNSGGIYVGRMRHLTLKADTFNSPDAVIQHIVEHVIIEVLGL